MIYSVLETLKYQKDEIAYEKEHRAFTLLGVVITYEVLNSLAGLLASGIALLYD